MNNHPDHDKHIIIYFCLCIKNFIILKIKQFVRPEVHIVHTYYYLNNTFCCILVIYASNKPTTKFRSDCYFNLRLLLIANNISGFVRL